MSDTRERNQTFEDALLCSPRFNTGDPDADRQAAIDWGQEAYQDDIPEPFIPSGHGALDAGWWPAQDSDLIELQEKGRLPDDADLEYGVTATAVHFRGIRKLDDGSFIAVVSGNASYANKVEEPASEPPAETEDAADRVAQDG
jgi:hypothetical protein